MKAVSLWQPWASLVALGVKTAETRSWSTNYRGPLAIHAAKRPVKPGDRVGDYLAVKDADYAKDTPPFLVRWPERTPLDPKEPWSVMPLGAVVARCELVDVVPTNGIFYVGDDAMSGAVNWSQMRDTDPDIDRDWETMIRERERPYGDYTPGRFVWLLENIRRIEPMPAKGRQGLFELTPG